jgi:hypothetical protein
MHIVAAFEEMVQKKAEARQAVNELVMPMMAGQEISKEDLKKHWDNINNKIDEIIKPFVE